MAGRTTTALVPTLVTAVAVTVLTVLTGAGCAPTLVAITPAPPTKTARLHGVQPLFERRRHVARLSTGVALAFNCEGTHPCRDVTMAIADPAIVKVLPAHLARLERSPLNEYSLPPSTFVLVGLKPGKTSILLRSDSGCTTIRVEVIE